MALNGPTSITGLEQLYLILKEAHVTGRLTQLLEEYDEIVGLGNALNLDFGDVIITRPAFETVLDRIRGNAIAVRPDPLDLSRDLPLVTTFPVTPPYAPTHGITWPLDGWWHLLSCSLQLLLLRVVTFM
jgi:hypothetical protein